MFRFFRKSPQEKKPPEAPTRSRLDRAIAESDLPTALAILDAEISNSPTIPNLFLAFELRLFADDFDGAQSNLEALLGSEPYDIYTPELLTAFAYELRPLIANACMWHGRQTNPDCEARRSSIVEYIPGYMIPLMLAGQMHARGDTNGAGDLLAEVKQQYPKLKGKLHKQSGGVIEFSDITDVDDLTGPVLAISTPDGLYDIPFEQIRSIEFGAAQNYLDSIWTPALATLWSGAPVCGRVPTYYVGTGHHESPFVRRLLQTAFTTCKGYAVAQGQRDFKFEPGHGLTGIIGTSRIEFTGPPRPMDDDRGIRVQAQPNG